MIEEEEEAKTRDQGIKKKMIKTINAYERQFVKLMKSTYISRRKNAMRCLNIKIVKAKNFEDI